MITMTVYSEEQCFRRGCEEQWTKIVSTPTSKGHGYYTRLCAGHELELKERAKILGGYSMVNAEDSKWIRGQDRFDNAWGWTLD
jgi:hypothetical protein